MIDISSLVYSRLVNDETLKKHLKGSGTTRNDTPPAFPYLYLKILGEPTTSTSLQTNSVLYWPALRLRFTIPNRLQKPGSWFSMLRSLCARWDLQ